MPTFRGSIKISGNIPAEEKTVWIIRPAFVISVVLAAVIY
jgi:hypothetical protein